LLLFLLSMLLSLPLFHATSSTTICTDPAKYEECFRDNPSMQNLMLVSDPSADDFETLLNADRMQAALYLNARYNTEFAAKYVATTDFITADASSTLVAERFFSEDADNVNEYKRKFSDYMFRQGVEIEISGDIEQYKIDGTLIGDNGAVNIKKFASDYAFDVNEDGEIVLIPLVYEQDWLISFEGTITQNSNGDIAMKSGSFNGLEVEDASSIWIGKEGKIIVDAQTFGSLEFQGKGHVIYDPDEQTYQVKDAVLEQYPEYKLTGTIIVDEGYIYDNYYVPVGKKLEVHPNTKNAEKEALNEQAYVIRANGGKQVLLNLNTDDWWENPTGYVIDWLKSAEDALYDEDRITIDPNKVVVAEAAPALEGYDHSYSLEIDAGAQYALQSESGPENDNFLPVPEDGAYKKGDYPKKGTAEYEAVQVIQGIVGTTQDGKYGSGTRAAVVSWQNSYNTQNNLNPGDAGYLAPDGSWGQEDTTAYFQMTYNHNQNPPTLVFDMGSTESGGIAVVHFEETGLDVTTAGDMDLEIEGQRLQIQDAEADRHLAGIIKQDVSVPVTLSSMGSCDTSADIAGQAVQGTYCEIFSTKIDAKTYDVNDGVVEGTIRASCPLALGNIDPAKAQCATYVADYAKVEGGKYTVYGSAGENYAVYLGEYGSSWQMSKNMQTHGGVSLYWKEQNGDMVLRDPRLAEQVDYNYDNFQEGDVVFFYYTKSTFLKEAYDEGTDGRQATHSARVIEKESESYTVSHQTDPAQYLQTQLGVGSDFLGGYPVWINGKRVLYSNGAYYNYDTKKGVVGSPIVLQQGDQVVVEKTMIAQMYHENSRDKQPFKVVDYGKFLSDNAQTMSLYEHVRPNTERTAEAAARFEGTTAIEVSSDKDIADALRASGVSEQDLPVMVELTREINNVPSSGVTKGDVIMLPSADTRRPEETIVENMEKGSISTANLIVPAVEASSKQRVAEYNLPNSEIDDLTEITLAIGMQESTWGETADWYYSSKLAAEEASARSGVGVNPTSSYGVLQVQTQVAERNAQELGEQDYTNAAELVDLEGGIKHGQRNLAKAMAAYTTEDMPYEEKLGIVATAHHIGYYAPVTTAVQAQLHDLGFIEKKDVDGYYGDGSVRALKKFADQNGLSFDETQAKNDCAYYGADMSTCTPGYLQNSPVYTELRNAWKEANPQAGEPPTVMVPPNNGYIRAVTKHCASITPVQTRCAYSSS
jgi:peptidoglycan hydrolase-like protein with peptidoglycan-binding domain